jgi:hypothetical protein
MRLLRGPVVLVALLVGCSPTPAPTQTGQFAPALSSSRLSGRTLGLRSTSIVSRGTGIVRPDRRSSHMKAGASGQDLLYVADPGTDDVDVYTFTGGAPAGVLTGFEEPQGECADKSGNVYVTNTRASNIVVFAHGATQPSKTLSDPGEYPVGCAINPRTQDLAVSNEFDTGFHNGSVSIYKHASGSPHTVSAPAFWQAFFLSYDDDGNIFLDGLSNDSYYRFLFAELAKGSSTFSTIPIDQTINYPGGVTWTGNALAIGDQEYAITQSAIYAVQVSAGSGKVVGTTVLSNTCDIVQFTIKKPYVVAPDACKAKVGLFAYPAGGTPKKGITSGLQAPVGSAVSLSPARTVLR